MALITINTERLQSKENISDYIYVFLTPILLFAIALFISNNGIRFPILSEWDSAAHFSMMKSSIENKSLLYQTPLPAYTNTISNPKNGAVTYPPGFYIVAANIFQNIEPVLPIKRVNIILTNYFYLFQLFYISLSIFYLSLLFELFVHKSNKLLNHLCLIFIFLSIYLLPNITSGFASFVTLSFFVIVYVYLYVYLYKFKASNINIEIFFLILLLLLISASWFVIIPPLFVATFFLLRKSLKKRTWYLLLLFTIVGVSVPILLQIIPTIKSDVNLVNMTINAGGGVQQFSILFYLFIAVINIIFFSSSEDKDTYIALRNLLLSLSGFIILIAIYQVTSSGKIGYYFYKTLIVLLIPASLPLYTLIQRLYQNINDQSLTPSKVRFFNRVLIFFTIFSFGYVAMPAKYLDIKSTLTKQEQNTLYIISDIYNLTNVDITVFPNKSVFILWNGAINERNSTFYKQWPSWTMKQNQAYTMVAKWLSESTSKDNHLMIDQDCWFNQTQRKSLQSNSKTELLWYRPGCID